MRRAIAAALAGSLAVCLGATPAVAQPPEAPPESDAAPAPDAAPVPDAAPAPANPEPPPSAEPSLFGPALMMGLGATSFVLGLVVHLLGIADRDAVENAPVGSSWDDYADRADRAPVLIGVGQLFMGAGVAIVAGAATWLGFALAESDEGSPESGAALYLTPGPASMSLRGRF